jgi:hypothetical protein
MQNDEEGEEVVKEDEGLEWKFYVFYYLMY